MVGRSWVKTVIYNMVSAVATTFMAGLAMVPLILRVAGCQIFVDCSTLTLLPLHILIPKLMIMMVLIGFMIYISIYIIARFADEEGEDKVRVRVDG